MRFDAKRFLQTELGSVQNVLALFAQQDDIPTLGAVEKWFQRGSVSGERLPAILYLLEQERGAPVSLAAYIDGDSIYD